MKKTLFIYFAVGSWLISCSSADDEFAAAANDLCDCMAKKSSDDELMRRIDLGLCLLNPTVDIKDARMTGAVAKACPDIGKVFEDYVEGL